MTIFVVAFTAIALFFSVGEGFFPSFSVTSTVRKTDYRAAFFFIFVASCSLVANNPYISLPLIALAVLLAIQTIRVRFVFDENALEVKVVDRMENGQEILKSSRGNFVYGGANRWEYQYFSDWYILPSPKFPLLVYFTETQTIPGDTKGHLFPIMMKADELKSVMLERVGPPKNSGF